MQRQRQRKPANSVLPKDQKRDRFTHLLADIRIGLGDRWAFYEECINGILEATAKKQDTTAWFEQMQQLVNGIDEVQFSHRGILFLLDDMTVRPSQPQPRGEGDGHERKYLSPPVSLSSRFSQTTDTLNATMGSSKGNANPRAPRGSGLSNIPFSSSLQPLQPPMGPGANSYIPRMSTPHVQQQQQQQQQTRRKQPQILRNATLPFDFSASVLPELTFPKDTKTYCYPHDQVNNKEHRIPPSNQLQPESSNPVFFRDPVLRKDVAELFGYTLKRKGGSFNGSGTNDILMPYQRLPYDPEEDDVTVWRAGPKSATDGEDGQVNRTSQMTHTTPSWNLRIDLELDGRGQ